LDGIAHRKLFAVLLHSFDPLRRIDSVDLPLPAGPLFLRASKISVIPGWVPSEKIERGIMAPPYKLLNGVCGLHPIDRLSHPQPE